MNDGFSVRLVYRVEKEQSIARARNKAVTSADGYFFAFIDDDKFPITNWLLTCSRAAWSEAWTASWGRSGRTSTQNRGNGLYAAEFMSVQTIRLAFESMARRDETGNVLLKRALFHPGEIAFRPELVTGEDQEVFRRKIAEPQVFAWCSGAIAYEVNPPARWKRSFVLRRALMRGRHAVIDPSFGIRDEGKSLLAITVYRAAVPVLCFMRQHQIVRYLEKLFFHLGTILAMARLNPVGARYICD